MNVILDSVIAYFLALALYALGRRLLGVWGLLGGMDTDQTAQNLRRNQKKTRNGYGRGTLHGGRHRQQSDFSK